MMRILAALAFSTAALAAAPASAASETAIFAGGCFWCVEVDFDNVPGVISTTSGYTGGHLDKPTYRDVVSETSGHREAVKIEYDPAKVSYDALVATFLRSIDPLDGEGQFCDRGESYTSAIFATDAQKASAEKAKAEAEAILKEPVKMLILPAATFFDAEENHQDFYKKDPLRYKYYRAGCGRDERIEKVWGAAAHQGIAAH